MSHLPIIMASLLTLPLEIFHLTFGQLDPLDHVRFTSFMQLLNEALSRQLYTDYGHKYKRWLKLGVQRLVAEANLAALTFWRKYFPDHFATEFQLTNLIAATDKLSGNPCELCDWIHQHNLKMGEYEMYAVLQTKDEALIDVFVARFQTVILDPVRNMILIQPVDPDKQHVPPFDKAIKLNSTICAAIYLSNGEDLLMRKSGEPIEMVIQNRYFNAQKFLKHASVDILLRYPGLARKILDGYHYDWSDCSPAVVLFLADQVTDNRPLNDIEMTWIVRTGDLKAIKDWIPLDKRSPCILMVAAQSRRFDIVEYFFDDLTGLVSGSYLTEAAESGSRAVFSYLMSQYRDTYDDEFDSAEFKQLREERNKHLLLNSTVELKACLAHAFQSRDLDFIRWLVKKYQIEISLSNLVQTVHLEGFDQAELVAFFQWLALQLPNWQEQVRNKKGQDLIMIAIDHHNTKIAWWLLEQGLPYNEKHLHQALRVGHLKLAWWFVQRGIELPDGTYVINKRVPLRDQSLVQKLQEHPGIVFCHL